MRRNQLPEAADGKLRRHDQRAAGDKRSQHRHAQAVDVIERQHAQGAVGGGQRMGQRRIGAAGQQIGVRQNDPLGAARGAGGIHQKAIALR